MYKSISPLIKTLFWSDQQLNQHFDFNRIGSLICIIGIFCIQSCVPAVEENYDDINISWQDTTIRNIYNKADQGDSKSLYKYINHKDASYRYFTALSLISVEDIATTDSLIKLIHDPVEEVRIAAIRALGQLKNEKAEKELVKAFKSDDSLGLHTSFNRYILEAIGQCGSQDQLNNIVSIQTYTPKDTMLLMGQAMAIYRYALRGMVSEDGTKVMIEFLKSSIYPQELRAISANYLYRAKKINLHSFAPTLIRAFNIETNPEIKQSLAIALGKTKSASALTVLKNTLVTEQDYRVICNIIRAFGNFEYESCRTEAAGLLKSDNLHIAQTAGDYFMQNGNGDNALDYKDLAKDTTLHEYVRTKMYAASLRHLPFYYSLTLNGMRYRLSKWFNESTDPYLKSNIIGAMSEDSKNYKFIYEKGFSDPHFAVKTASAMALRKIFESDKHDQIFGALKNWRRKEMIAYFHNMFRSGDVGVIAELAPVLSSKKYDFQGEKNDFLYLDTILQSLTLPTAIETYNILNGNISYLKGKDHISITPVYNNPMDWEFIDRISENTTAEINTTKGTIKIKFTLYSTPATVVNFLKLAEAGYYNGKSFHRVVSDFVIQTGCPRGDGYGSLQQTIRTELESSSYHESGKIGMASAGRNTESTQWFITHVPTPFLDGNYTVFGEVSEGMEIVHRIHVGDIIRDIKINNIKNEENNTD